MTTTTEHLSDRKTCAETIEQAGGLTPPRSEEVGDGAGLESRDAEFLAFPVECFPGPVREYVQSQALELDCDESAVALPVLAALATAIGSTRRIRLKRDWTEPAVLWTAIVADSETRCRPPLDAAVGVLNERQVSQFPLFEQNRTSSPRRSTVEREPFPFLIDPFDEPARPAEPVVERCVSSDWTAASVIRLLTRQPRGLLVCCEELDGWLGRANPARNRGSVEVAHWLALHSGRSLIVEGRTVNQAPTHLPLPCVSITGTIHPMTFVQQMKKSGGRGQESGVRGQQAGVSQANAGSCGVLSRLLLAFPPSRPRCWRDDEVDETVTRGYAAVMEKLVALPFLDQPTDDVEGHCTRMGSNPDVAQCAVADESGPATSPQGNDSDPIDESRLQRCRAAAWHRLEFMDPESLASLEYSLANWDANHDPRWFRGPKRIVITTARGQMAERLARYLYMVPGSRYEKNKVVLNQGKTPTPVLVELSPEAKSRFARLVNERGRGAACLQPEATHPSHQPHQSHSSTGVGWKPTLRQSDANFPSLGPQPLALSQLEPYAARLALVLHLARWASGESIDPAVCDATSMEHGITLARWFANEASRIQSLLCETPDQRDRRLLIDWLHRCGGQGSARDLCRANGRRYPTTDAAESALKRLAEEGVGGWVELPAGELGGRPFRVLDLGRAEGRGSRNKGKTGVASDRSARVAPTKATVKKTTSVATSKKQVVESTTIAVPPNLPKATTDPPSIDPSLKEAEQQIREEIEQHRRQWPQHRDKRTIGIAGATEEVNRESCLSLRVGVQALACNSSPKAELQPGKSTTPPSLARWTRAFALLRDSPEMHGQSSANAREPPRPARWGRRFKH